MIRFAKNHLRCGMASLLNCQPMIHTTTHDQIIDGWLNFAVCRHSPNQNDRPDPDQIDLIVIHGISLPPGEFGGEFIDALFNNCLDPNGHPYFKEIQGLEVSAHVLIRRDGTAEQYVPFDRRAWHAGVSEYEGRERCNDFSIGIELEGTDDCPYDDRQYLSLERVIRCLLAHYPSLSKKRIAGHCDIAPGRKTDPGPCFDWDRLNQLLA